MVIFVYILSNPIQPFNLIYWLLFDDTNCLQHVFLEIIWVEFSSGKHKNLITQGYNSRMYFDTPTGKNCLQLNCMMPRKKNANTESWYFFSTPFTSVGTPWVIDFDCVILLLGSFYQLVEFVSKRNCLQRATKRINWKYINYTKKCPEINDKP